ncbi:hypothetical protein R9X49_21955 [Pectobacterium carotovorum]|uniref:hypothetical protein n=1 Tax=Pectobacterium carotovorum TaxID=554 RepID=UPI0029DD5066|nr:hypothetical protein [Pectobacterium carotovorum]MDX6917763.1 hypothetical protein [Pectobacterium carotovorum]
MFNTISEARTFLTNHGYFDAINLDFFDEIIKSLYLNAVNKESADTIVGKYI